MPCRNQSARSRVSSPMGPRSIVCWVAAAFGAVAAGTPVHGPPATSDAAEEPLPTIEDDRRPTAGSEEDGPRCFAAPVDHVLPFTTDATAMADLEGDGDLDLVAMSWGIDGPSNVVVVA